MSIYTPLGINLIIHNLNIILIMNILKRHHPSCALTPRAIRARAARSTTHEHISQRSAVGGLARGCSRPFQTRPHIVAAGTPSSSSRWARHLSPRALLEVGTVLISTRLNAAESPATAAVSLLAIESSTGPLSSQRKEQAQPVLVRGHQEIEHQKVEPLRRAVTTSGTHQNGNPSGQPG